MLKVFVFLFILNLFCKPDLKQDDGLLLPNQSPSRRGGQGRSRRWAGTLHCQRSPWLSLQGLQPLPAPEGSRGAGIPRGAGTPGPAAPSLAGPGFLRCLRAWPLPTAGARGQALCLLFPYNLRAFLTLIFLFLF